MQTAWGPPYAVCEWPGLGSDPFNLMPIIEQHQKTRKKKQKRRKRVGGVYLGMTQTATSSQGGCDIAGTWENDGTRG